MLKSSDGNGFCTVHPAVAGFAASTWGLSFSGSISSGDLCGEGKGFAPQSESIFSPFAKDGGGSEDAGASTEHCGVGDAWGEERAGGDFIGGKAD